MEERGVMDKRKLLAHITALQKQLIRLSSRKGSLTDSEVVSKSEELDKFIIKYMMLTTERSK
ncbi:aspartyl-phosphate phosphatase Spo0E family protein [Brevibacillus gelatini]|uniref:Aspartyl-phosphate phosphatase Spo0E family protein n=2 Tax=Brevibacillus gelatini TaxID=1655277 RepID=A0A3M8AQR2_9BACL|nr:aspartyl-phosphate phosphatase Spo0E family protein [Brevibacillus gelatini]